jgi:hypothetical protein
MIIVYIETNLNYLDPSDANDTPRGNRFMPAPAPIPEGQAPVRSWPDSLEQEFEEHLAKGVNRFVLTATKRADIQYHHRNPHAPARGATPAEKLKDSNTRTWALASFHLQNNQVFRNSYTKKNDQVVGARYCACISDILELIKRIHENHSHFGVNKTLALCTKDYYGIMDQFSLSCASHRVSKLAALALGTNYLRLTLGSVNSPEYGDSGIKYREYKVVFTIPLYFMRPLKGL